MRRLVLVVALLAVLGLPSCGLLPGGGGTYEVTAYFPRAVSLYEESEIRILGLPGGRVRSVEPDGSRIRVVLAIDDDAALPADAQAAIVPQSLIGERYVQLFPAWTGQGERLADGDVIPIEHTIVPVEPDEALDALKEFLDTLDPDAAGRLISNAADTLEGNGEHLGRALTGLATLTGTLADKDDALVGIVEQMDRLATTLVEREAELGQVMDLFAEVTATLAAERQQIEGLVGGLARTATAGVDLVSRNAVQLRTDITRLTRVAATVGANLDAVDDLLRTSDDFPANLRNAYDPELRRIDLRNSFSPAVTELLQTVPGLPRAICLPIDVQCDADALPVPIPPASVSSRSANGPVFGATPGPAPSLAETVARGIRGSGRSLQRAAGLLLGVGR